MKPKLTIDNFAGMGDNGIVWAECCAPKKIGGQSVMTGSGNITKWNNDDDTQFSGLGKIAGFDTIKYGVSDYIVCYDANDKLYIVDPRSGELSIGEIHESAEDGGNYSDLITTIDGDILYTNQDTMGIGWYGECDTGSSTTQIVDKEGRDLATDLGLSVGDKIYNITNKEEYTITSFPDTDTMAFSEGTACSAGQIFYAFRDDAFNFIGDVTATQFVGQPSIGNWHRPILLFGNYYYVLNGNYLGQMPVDQTTWESGAADVLVEDFKQLPYNMQGVCMDINADKLLIGGTLKTDGKLILWDGYSDGWLNEIILEDTPNAIKAYKDGWVILVRNTLYFTNGYQLQKISSYPVGRGEDETITDMHNGMTILEDKILISSGQCDEQRLRAGVVIYYPESGWNYIPIRDEDFNFGYNDDGYGGAIFSFSSSNICFVSQKQFDGDCLNRVAISASRGLNTTRMSFIYYVKLPEPMKISGVGLNVSSLLDYENQQDEDINITVNYGDGKDALFKSGQKGATSTKTNVVNTQGATRSAKLGQKLLMLDEDVSGEITYVTAVANQGTATEALTVSPALSSVSSNAGDMIIQNLKLTKTETITNTDIPNELNFDIENFYSDKLFIEVVVEGNYPLDIHSINVY